MDRQTMNCEENETADSPPRDAWLPPEVVAAWSDLSFAAKALTVPLAATLSWCRRAYVGVPDLQARSGLRSPSSVCTGLHLLMAIGLLTRIRRWRTCSVYWWAVAGPVDGPGAVRIPARAVVLWPQLSFVAQALFGALAACFTDQPEVALRVEELQARAGLGSRGSVATGVRLLEEYGLILRQRRHEQPTLFALAGTATDRPRPSDLHHLERNQPDSSGTP